MKNVSFRLFTTFFCLSCLLGIFLTINLVRSYEFINSIRDDHERFLTFESKINQSLINAREGVKLFKGPERLKWETAINGIERTVNEEYAFKLDVVSDFLSDSKWYSLNLDAAFEAKLTQLDYENLFNQFMKHLSTPENLYLQNQRALAWKKEPSAYSNSLMLYAEKVEELGETGKAIAKNLETKAKAFIDFRNEFAK